VVRRTFDSKNRPAETPQLEGEEATVTKSVVSAVPPRPALFVSDSESPLVPDPAWFASVVAVGLELLQVAKGRRGR